jgi:NADH-quinone oxidoreductase subunit I
MPPRFRGHIKLNGPGYRQVAAAPPARSACAPAPATASTVDGLKKEGEKKKSVSKYKLDFTTCSLCGSCVEACPSDAIEFSKDYNVVSRIARRLRDGPLLRRWRPRPQLGREESRKVKPPP